MSCLPVGEGDAVRNRIAGYRRRPGPLASPEHLQDTAIGPSGGSKRDRSADYAGGLFCEPCPTPVHFRAGRWYTRCVSSEPGPEHPVAASVTRSIANGGVATGVAYGLGLNPQLSGAVGATVVAASSIGDAVAAVSRRKRGSPGPTEQALRSIICDYLSEMQELLKSEKGLGRNSSYAERVKEYAGAIGPYDEDLAVALLSLNGALVLNADFRTAKAESKVRDALLHAQEISRADIRDPGTVRDVEGFWSHFSLRKRPSST